MGGRQKMEREDAREILKWMLGQVRRAEQHKKELMERLERINEDRKHPIKAVGYDPMPRSAGIGDGAASILLKLADIEERIYDQRTEIENSIVQVMDIIDFIPQSDTARRIFELRHLDCLNFQDVADAIPMSKSRTYEIYNETIDKLLDFEKISQMCKENEDAYLEWYMNMEDRRRKAEKSSGGYKSQNRNRKKKRKK
jgi:hypothetical protein